MVLESLFSARKMLERPINMLFFSFIITVMSVYISYFIFPIYAGIISPLFVTIGTAPLLLKIFAVEEKIERLYAENKLSENFLERYEYVIILFAFFFIGSFIAYFTISLIIPDKDVYTIFLPQINEISTIKSLTTGSVYNESNTLFLITSNNLRVMLTCFMLSLIFGTGALFILSWNASILAIYLVSFIRQGMIEKFFISSLGIIPHAPFEIGAYFVSGIAGGMLSMGLLRENIKSKEFRIILRDSIFMLSISVIIIILGAFIEVYV
ncbi:MAG: stage II sporulation protein M [Candidatus Aenigmarchaeota archaeon]|nr:stage II sporulation protein M [Candidatus Aenigmarchaeota archaeon]